MAKIELNKTLIIAFVLIAGLVIFNFLNYTGMVINEKEEWACSQYVCDKAITAQEWINNNCYRLPDGSNEIVCKVIIDGKEQLVPLSMINTQTLNQCVEARCVQEARVRPVNYTVNLQNSQ